MSMAVITASRRALAVFVLFVAGVLAVWVAEFRVGSPDFPLSVGGRPGPTINSLPCAVGTNYCNAVRPAWTIPVAATIALVGIVVAVLLYQRRRGPADLRALQAGGFDTELLP